MKAERRSQKKTEKTHLLEDQDKDEDGKPHTYGIVKDYDGVVQEQNRQQAALDRVQRRKWAVKKDE